MSKNFLYSFEDKKNEENDNNYSLPNPKFNFYPPILDSNDNFGQYEIFNNAQNIPKYLNNGLSKETNSNNEDENIYEVNNDFFESLLGKNNYNLNKEKKIRTISKIIRSSKLIEKLEKECISSSKETGINELSINCAKNISFLELKKGKTIFKIGDKGDKFFFIIKGKVSILKPRKFYEKMNLQEYISYLFLLIKGKEDYLLNEVILNNCANIPIVSIDEIKMIYKIFFKNMLKKNIEDGKIKNNRNLKIFFEKNLQSFNEYNLDSNYLEILEEQKSKKTEKDTWNNYVIEKCNLSKGDFQIMKRYNEYNNNYYNIMCYLYDLFLYLGSGFFFGDSALEGKGITRNATIRAEEDTILGFLKSDDYLNIIAPQRKIEKMKEINFLMHNFFFRDIKTSIFEQNLFHFFTLNENKRGSVLFNCESKPNYLFFLKEGNISLTLDASIIDINNILEKICTIIIEQYSKNLIQKKIIKKDIINILKKNIGNDKILSNLKKFSKEFIQEIYKKRNIQIAQINGVEIIGLEEIFLNIPYMTYATVINEKIIYYKIETERIKNILLDNNCIKDLYLKSSINKILILIERLQNLKENYIKLAKMKYENPNSFRKQNLPSLKNKNINNHKRSTLIQNSSHSISSKTKRFLSRNVINPSKQNEKEYQISSYNSNKIKISKKNNAQDNDNNNSCNLFQNSLIKNAFYQTINDINFKNKNNSKFMDFFKSFRGSNKLNLFKLKLDEIKINKKEESGKNTEKTKNINTCVLFRLGEKTLYLDKHKKNLSYTSYRKDKLKKKLLTILNSLQSINEMKNKTNNDQKEFNSAAIFVSEQQTSLDKDKSLTSLRRNKSTLYKNNQLANIFQYSLFPLLNLNENGKKNINISLDKKINDLISCKMDRDHFNISKANKKKSFNKNSSYIFKNKSIFLKKTLFNNININEKSNLIKNTSNLKKANDDLWNESNRSNFINNIELIDFSCNTINSNNSKNIIPSISPNKINLNTSSEIKNKNNNNNKIKIPEIVKNFYNNQKKKGYVSLIPNKISNTIFLKKYYKKYNQMIPIVKK